VRVELTETQRQLRDTIRAFAAERLRPTAAATDRDGRVPRELVAELGRLGVMGCVVPERYGGAGFDHVAYALAIEELAAACASTAAIVTAHASLATWPILAFGSDAQRARYLPKLASGEWLGCFASSVEGGLVARRDRDDWVLDGRARFVANASEAHVAVAVAAVDPDGVSAFVVETASPGWRVESVAERTGLRGAAPGDVALEAVRVPRANRLGDEAGGAAIAGRTLDAARIATAATAVGIARACLEDSLVYARQRRAFGQPLAEFQGLQWRLADMAAAVEAGRLLTLRAASLFDRGLPYSGEASMAKLYAAESAMALATQAVQMHGGYGYTREFAVERYFRDATVIASAAGTPEALRLAVADHLLGETARA